MGDRPSIVTGLGMAALAAALVGASVAPPGYAYREPRPANNPPQPFDVPVLPPKGGKRAKRRAARLSRTSGEQP